MRQLIRGAASLAAASFVALAAASCDSPSGGGGDGGPAGRGPEWIPAAFAVESVVEGETFQEMDTDTFTFQGTAGEEMVAYFQLTGTGAGVVEWSIPGVPASFVEGRAGSTELDARATPRFTLPETRTYTVVVRAVAGDAQPYTGPYRFQIRRIDRRPETAARVLTPGQTISEAVEFKGDVDVFVVRNTPGLRYVLFFQATGTALDSLKLDVIAEIGGAVRHDPPTADPALVDEALQIFVPAGDSAIIAVTGVGETRHKGPYRLMVYAASLSPETTPEVLPLGADRRGESLDLPGDIDLFYLDIDRPTLVNVVASQDPAPALSALHGDTGLVVELIEPETVHPPLPTITGGNLAGGSGTRELAPGRWTLRVSGAPARRFRGPYRIQALAIDPAPEDAAPVLAVGTTVTERFGPMGDLDIFTFAGTRGHAYRLLVEPTGPATAVDPLGPSGINVVLKAPGELVGQGSQHRWNSGRAVGGARLLAPATASYQVRINSLKGGRLYADTGSYRLTLESYPTTPERVSGTIAPGAVVTGESIDEVSDIDDFLVTGTPGEELTVSVRAPSTGYLHFYALDPVTLDSLAYAFAFTSESNRLTVRPGPSGQVLVRVLDAPCSSVYCAFTGSVGAYRLEVTRNAATAPASTPSTAARRTTVGASTPAPSAGTAPRTPARGRRNR